MVGRGVVALIFLMLPLAPGAGGAQTHWAWGPPGFAYSTPEGTLVLLERDGVEQTIRVYDGDGALELEARLGPWETFTAALPAQPSTGRTERISSLGTHRIESTGNVTAVWADLDRHGASAGRSRATTELGTEHVLSGLAQLEHRPAHTPDRRQWLGMVVVVAVQDGTDVTIEQRRLWANVTFPTMVDGPSAADAPRSMRLDAGQAWVVVQAEAMQAWNWTLARVSSSAPVAVFHGDVRATHAGGQDAMLEQVPPTSSWPRTHVVCSPARWFPGVVDVVRVVPADPASEVSVVPALAPRDAFKRWGELGPFAPVVAFEFNSTADRVVSGAGPTFVQVASSRRETDMGGTVPVLRYSTGLGEGPALQQFTTVPGGDEAVLVAGLAGIPVTLDGAPLAMEPIGGTGYACGHARVTAGNHALESDGPLGVTVLGVDATHGAQMAYGYDLGHEPGGTAPAPVPQRPGTSEEAATAAPSPSPGARERRTAGGNASAAPAEPGPGTLPGPRSVPEDDVAPSAGATGAHAAAHAAPGVQATSRPPWPALLGAVLAVAAVAFFLLAAGRRRRAERDA